MAETPPSAAGVIPAQAGTHVHLAVARASRPVPSPCPDRVTVAERHVHMAGPGLRRRMTLCPQAARAPRPHARPSARTHRVTVGELEEADGATRITPELRAAPSARCGLGADVGRRGGRPLHARPRARRPAAGRQGRRPPRSQDRPDLRELRRRGHDPADRRPSTARSSRAAAATAGAARARRAASTIGCPRLAARPAARQRASTSSSATRWPARSPRSAAAAWCATWCAASARPSRRTSMPSCAIRQPSLPPAQLGGFALLWGILADRVKAVLARLSGTGHR